MQDVESQRPIRMSANTEERERPLPLLDRIIGHWASNFGDQPAFAKSLAGELLTAYWEDSVALMTSLQNTETADRILEARNRIQTPQKTVQRVKRWSRTDAEVVLSTLQYHIALNFVDGDRVKSGIERHLKAGRHAPMEPFSNPWRFFPKFENGIARGKRGDRTLWLSSGMSFGTLVYVSSRTSDTVALAQAPLWLGADQISALQGMGIEKGSRATIIRGQAGLSGDRLIEQVRGLVGPKGIIGVSDRTAFRFDAAIAPDDDLLIIDHLDSPQWSAADISSLAAL